MPAARAFTELQFWPTVAGLCEAGSRGTAGVKDPSYSLGSLDETQSHLCAAYDRGHISKDQFARLWQEGTEIRKLTVAFIRSMILPRGGVRTLGKPPSWSSKVWEIYERTTGKPRPDAFAPPPPEEQIPPRNNAPRL